MKVLYIESKRKLSANKINLSALKELNSIHILYPIQYKSLAEKIKQVLGNKVKAIEQVLGCSKITPQGNLLLIGSGRFHALQIALDTGKEVYILEGNNLSKISEEEIEKARKLEKGKLLKFYSASSLGLLVSLKPGQNHLEEALKFKEKLKKNKNKKAYIFLAETLNLAELENFPIDFWLNFACPGIELDSSEVLNYEHLRT